MRPTAILSRAAILFALIVPLRAAELRVGVASVDVTPPKGTPMAGYYHERGAEGTHDPLYAKAILLDDGQTKAVLVALDLISTTRPFVEEARRLIQQQSGVPAENIMISGTHSHTGPVFAGTRRYDIMGGSNPLAVEYTRKLPSLIADAVHQASQNLAEGRVSYSAAPAENLAFNRRFHMRDGSVGWNPGKLNPNILHPAGPVDPEVQVVYFERPKSIPLATYVNFPMHLDTVGGQEFSADYPYVLSEILGKAKSPEMITAFTIGCAGDINHINVKSALPQKGHAEAARIATHLASAVLRSYENLVTLSNPVLRVSSQLIDLPLPNITKEQVAEAEKIFEAIRSKSTPAPKFMDQVQAFKVLDVHERNGEPIPAEVQVIALGQDVAWVSLPGEIFVELGLSIKAGSPFKETIIATLANGSVGYVPTWRAYAEGNYEVVTARCAEGSGELLVQSALKQLRKIYRGNL